MRFILSLGLNNFYTWFDLECYWEPPHSLALAYFGEQRSVAVRTNNGRMEPTRIELSRSALHSMLIAKGKRFLWIVNFPNTRGPDRCENLRAFSHRLVLSYDVHRLPR